MSPSPAPLHPVTFPSPAPLRPGTRLSFPSPNRNPGDPSTDWNDPPPADWNDPPPADWNDPPPADWNDPREVGKAYATACRTTPRMSKKTILLVLVAAAVLLFVTKR